ncbi:eCIS core domain-containing protein [Streptomyces sp. NPDC002067]
MPSQEKKSKNPGARQTPAPKKSAAPPDDMLALQRSVGNAAVSAWLRMSAGKGTLDAPGLTALQRSIGNSAVNHLVSRSASSAHTEEEAAEHGNSTGAQEQPLAVHNVLRSSGRPMENGLRQEMEQRFGDGVDFGSVRFHTGDQAAQSATELQARAYTVRNHVVFGKGVERDKKTVAHELAHVVENEKGTSFTSVPYGDNVNVSEVNGPSEVAAEATAERVMSTPAPAPSAAPAGHDTTTVARRKSDGGGSAPSAGLPAVQRALTVGDRDFTKEYQAKTARRDEKDHAAILKKMTDEVSQHFLKDAAKEFSPEERKDFVNEAKRINWQLAKAIVSPVGLKNEYHPALRGVVGTHPDFGAKNHDIQVNNYTDLARNLMGWVYAKDNRRQEKKEAEKMHRDPDLDIYLNVLLRRMHGYTRAVQKGRNMSDRDIAVMEQELRTGRAHIRSQITKDGVRDPDKQAGKPVGSYIAHFDGTMNKKFRGTRLDARIMDRGGLTAVMKDPEKFDLREKMIVLHDLSEYFGHSTHTPPTAGKKAVPEMTEDDQQSTLAFDHRGKRVSTTRDRGQNALLHDDGTPKLNDRGKPATHPSTRNENSETTRNAREKDIPVWAGQSWTAARMFRMAVTSGASLEEIAALGWGIFAFWRTDFDHTTDFAYHTLHEVMDIAQNFGLSYNINKPYGSYRKVDTTRVGAKVDTLLSNVSDIRSQAKDLVRGMKDAKLNNPRRWGRREEELLGVFIDIKEDAEVLQEKIQRRADSLRGWSRLTDEERTDLLKKVIDSLNNWHDELGDLQQTLSRHSR